MAAGSPVSSQPRSGSGWPPTMPENTVDAQPSDGRRTTHTGSGHPFGPRSPQHRLPVGQIVLSWLGGFLGTAAVTLPGHLLHVSPAGLVGVVGSFGASAVLIYGLPGAELAQPRNLVLGHVVSATVGVTAFRLLGGYPPLAAAVAVASAIAAMHLTRSLHPPGGATALIAVIGGPTIHHLGYLYVAAPVLLGAIVMLSVGLIVNNLPMTGRRDYPTKWW